MDDAARGIAVQMDPWAKAFDWGASYAWLGNCLELLKKEGKKHGKRS